MRGDLAQVGEHGRVKRDTVCQPLRHALLLDLTGQGNAVEPRREREFPHFRQKRFQALLEGLESHKSLDIDGDKEVGHVGGPAHVAEEARGVHAQRRAGEQ